MSDVSIAPSSVEMFVDRLSAASLAGGDPTPSCVEDGNVLRLQEAYRCLAAGDFAPMIAQMAEAAMRCRDAPYDLCAPPG